MMTLQGRISKLELQDPQGAGEVPELSDEERARRILAMFDYVAAHPNDEQALQEAVKVCEVLGLLDDS